MKLKPHRVCGKRPARQPRPLDRAFAFLDPLLASAALVVEGDDPLRPPCHVGDDEADTRIKLSGMPFDLRNHPARPQLAGSRLPALSSTARSACEAQQTLAAGRRLAARFRTFAPFP